MQIIILLVLSLFITIASSQLMFYAQALLTTTKALIVAEQHRALMRALIETAHAIILDQPTFLPNLALMGKQTITIQPWSKKISHLQGFLTFYHYDSSKLAITIQLLENNQKHRIAYLEVSIIATKPRLCIQSYIVEHQPHETH